MLTITQKRKGLSKRSVVSLLAIAMMGAGVYALVLVSAPAAVPIIAAAKPIDVASLPAPQKSDNRIVIPKIGVDIAYGTGAAALDRGAEWRAPTSGNPQDGGNFVIAAHRFSIQPTPKSTVEKSPFYHIDQLTNGDKIVIDYEGKRYGYEVEKEFTVKPTQIEIEARTNDPLLTLYSCGLSGADGERYVVQAKRLGEVAVNQTRS